MFFVVYFFLLTGTGFGVKITPISLPN